MNWNQFFSMDTLISLGLPVGIGILVALAIYLLRRFLYKYIHKLAAKTATQFDDIMLRETRLPTLFWCIWLGIYVGFTVYTPPESWAEITNKLIPVLFVAIQS
jgi:hypothetical protein